MIRENNKKRKKDNAVRIISSLINIEGKLDLKGTVRIDGRIKGEINSTGTLIIGSTADVECLPD